MKKNNIVLIFCVLANIVPVCKGKVSQIIINKGDNALSKLNEFGLTQAGKPLRLHLGCGENHFNGYINVDFPSSEHTVQQASIADVYADITNLNFPEISVDEIRSHHIFEHFERPISMGLLCNWNKWLKIGGRLVIETPDFEASVKLFLDQTIPYKEKQKILRHVFGSHEARWAVHCDGWYQEKFADILEKLGFSDITFNKLRYYGVLNNITVTAYKKKSLTMQELEKAAKKILEESLVSPVETKMFSVWCSTFDKYFYK